MNTVHILFRALVIIWGTASSIEAGSGTLRVHPDNPRYFTDNAGKAILLTGSHTWNNLVDMELDGSRETFDYDAHLDWLQSLNHNFFRLWAWELLTFDTSGHDKGESRVLHVAPLLFSLRPRKH